MAPSVLAADHNRLIDQAGLLKQCGVTCLHEDIMWIAGTAGSKFTIAQTAHIARRGGLIEPGETLLLRGLLNKALHSMEMR